MIHGSCNMKHDRHNFVSFWAFFELLPTLSPLQISSFYMPEPKIMSLWCMVPEILCTMDQWLDRQTNRQKKWHSRHKQTQALTISFSNMVKHSNSYIKCRVWPNGSCFVIHDEVLNFHDWIICYHELFHNKIKKDN